MSDSPNPEVPAKKILVVDDDESMTFGLKKFLSSKGYAVEIAVDGQEGLMKAKSDTPNLIILDVVMPKIDGWSLIRHLRIVPELTFTPIIFLSGLGSEDDRLKGFKLGADDFLPKPFTFEELDFRVKKALSYSENLRKNMERELDGFSEGPAFKGSLDELSLSSLLTLCILERKSGILKLFNGDDTSGTLYIHNGEVVSAQTESKPVLEGEEAIYQMFSWAEGQFEFEKRDTSGVIKQISTRTVTVLLQSVEKLNKQGSDKE